MKNKTIQTFTILLISIFLAIPLIAAAPNPGHSAAAIGSGTFTPGNYSFNGSVGIGTANPATPLDVYTTGFNELRFGNDIGGGTGASLRINSDGSKAFAVADTAGVDIFVVNKTTTSIKQGKVGIGTAIPADLLHINGSTEANSEIRITTGADALMGTEIGPNTFRFLRSDGSGTINYAYGLRIAQNGQAWGAPALFLDSRGNASFDAGVLFVDAEQNRVGIGTTTPVSNLQLAATTSDNHIRITTDATGHTTASGVLWGSYYDGSQNENYFINKEYGYMTFYTSADGVTAKERIRILSDGRVGINTSTPANTLNVVGDLNVTGTSYLGNIIISADNITANNIIPKDNNIVKVPGSLNVSGTIYAHNFTGNSDITFINSTGGIIALFKESGDMKMGSQNQNNFVINSTSGKIGIGTSTPAATLDIKSSGISTNLQQWTYTNGNAAGKFYEGGAGMGQLFLNNGTGSSKIVNNFGSKGQIFLYNSTHSSGPAEIDINSEGTSTFGALTTGAISSGVITQSGATLANTYLSLSGGTMTGNIAMGANNITSTTGYIAGHNYPVTANVQVAQQMNQGAGVMRVVNMVEVNDPQGVFTEGAAHHYDCPVTGYYQLDSCINVYNVNAGAAVENDIFMNGVQTCANYAHVVGAGDYSSRCVSCLVKCTAGWQIQVKSTSATDGDYYIGAGGSYSLSFFTAYLVSL